MDRSDILEDNMKNLYSILWGKFTEALLQGLCGHEDFDEKYIDLDAKWLLKQTKLTTQGMKEGKHSNPYDSVYKLIRI